MGLSRGGVGWLGVTLLMAGCAREPLRNSLRTQRVQKGAAVVFCRDGQGGSLS